VCCRLLHCVARCVAGWSCLLTLQFVVAHCSESLCAAAVDMECGSALHSVAVCCNALQCVDVAVRCSALQCVAVRCSALQCVAVCCSVLQCVSVDRLLAQKVSGISVHCSCIAVHLFQQLKSEVAAVARFHVYILHNPNNQLIHTPTHQTLTHLTQHNTPTRTHADTPHVRTLLRAWTSALASINCLAVSLLPLAAAKCNGVDLSCAMRV